MKQHFLLVIHVISIPLIDWFLRTPFISWQPQTSIHLASPLTHTHTHTLQHDSVARLAWELSLLIQFFRDQLKSAATHQEQSSTPEDIADKSRIIRD